MQRGGTSRGAGVVWRGVLALVAIGLLLPGLPGAADDIGLAVEPADGSLTPALTTGITCLSSAQISFYPTAPQAGRVVRIDVLAPTHSMEVTLLSSLRLYFESDAQEVDGYRWSWFTWSESPGDYEITFLDSMRSECATARLVVGEPGPFSDPIGPLADAPAPTATPTPTRTPGAASSTRSSSSDDKDDDADLSPARNPTATRTRTSTRTPRPTRTPEPEEMLRPTRTPASADMPRPTRTPEPETTLRPTRTPEPENTPRPTRTPEPEDTPRPTGTPTPTATEVPRPDISGTDPSSAMCGARLTIKGTGFGSSRSAVSGRVEIAGRAVAAYDEWSDTAIGVILSATSPTGPGETLIVETRGGADSWEIKVSC